MSLFLHTVVSAFLALALILHRLAQTKMQTNKLQVKNNLQNWVTGQYIWRVNEKMTADISHACSLQVKWQIKYLWMGCLGKYIQSANYLQVLGRYCPWRKSGRGHNRKKAGGIIQLQLVWLQPCWQPLQEKAPCVESELRLSGICMCVCASVCMHPASSTQPVGVYQTTGLCVCHLEPISVSSLDCVYFSYTV